MLGNFYQPWSDKHIFPKDVSWEEAWFTREKVISSNLFFLTKGGFHNSGSMGCGSLCIVQRA